jgi:hypothetical protein
MTIKNYIAILILSMLVAPFVRAETATVVTKESAIRADCKFYSPVVAKVSFKDEMEVISQQGDWYRVRFHGVQGCIHKNALDKKYISVSSIADSSQGTASVEEVSLAGKGFVSVEKTYQDRNPSVNFKIVEQIESLKIPEEELISFVRAGSLHLP